MYMESEKLSERLLVFSKKTHEYYLKSKENKQQNSNTEESNAHSKLVKAEAVSPAPGIVPYRKIHVHLHILQHIV